MLLDFIVWDVNPRIFSINGWGPVWYGLLFAAAFLLGQQLLFYIYRKDGKPDSEVEALTIYVVLATIVGARLGHVLFYDWEAYSKNPLEILMIWKGGLASHGATIAIVFALWLYSRRRKDQSFLWIIDRIVITVALGGALIRMGNLMNSEIYGKSTDVPWAFVFALPEGMENHFNENAESMFGKDVLKDVKAYKNTDQTLEQQGEKFQKITYEFDFDKRKTDTLQVRKQTGQLVESLMGYSSFRDNIFIEEKQLNSRITLETDTVVSRFDAYGKLRHPTQIYEALFCIFLLALTFWMWRYKREVLPSGVISAVFIILLFSFRIAVEFLKKEQVEIEKGMTLNIGQQLSIPAVLFGIGMLIWAYRKPKKSKIPSLRKEEQQ